MDCTGECWKKRRVSSIHTLSLIYRHCYHHNHHHRHPFPYSTTYISLVIIPHSSRFPPATSLFVLSRLLSTSIQQAKLYPLSPLASQVFNGIVAHTAHRSHPLPTHTVCHCTCEHGHGSVLKRLHDCNSVLIIP